MEAKTFKQVLIKSGFDLPKEDGRYYVHFKVSNFLDKLKKWTFTKGANDYYWLRDIDWYLQPIEKIEDKTERTAKELKNKIYDKITDDLKGARLEGLETDDGDKYPLLDFLSTEDTIETGLSEINNLVEQIDIDELLHAYHNQFPEQRELTDEEIDLFARGYGELLEGNKNGELTFAFREGATFYRSQLKVKNGNS